MNSQKTIEIDKYNCIQTEPVIGQYIYIFSICRHMHVICPGLTQMLIHDLVGSYKLHRDECRPYFELAVHIWLVALEH